MEFLPFQHAIAVQFDKLSKQPLFRTGAEKDDLWTTYLSSFPEGSNPVYKERTEHDCNCCKQFIRAVGNVVGIVNGKLESIWDVKLDNENYQAVADAMSKFVKSKAVVDSFLHYEKQAGTQKSFQDTIEGVKTWNHFFVQIPKQFVKPNADIATALSLTRSTHDVFLRALSEIPMDSVDTVLELISQNSIYRGVSLDGIARGLNKKLKSTDDVSFVVNVTKVDELTQLQFDIAKHIIDVRVAEAKALSDKRAKKEKKDALLALIAEKEGDALKGLSVDDLRKQLAALED